jgi:hypothetical protein
MRYRQNACAAAADDDAAATDSRADNDAAGDDNLSRCFHASLTDDEYQH